MPSANVKSFAEKSGKSVAQVEKIWDETKEEATKKFKHGTPKFWAYVNKTVQYKLGIAVKESLSFKDYLILEKQVKPEDEIKIADKVQLVKAIKGLPDASIGEVYTVNDVAENGDLKIDNAFGPEWHDKYFSKKLFTKVPN